MAKKLSAINTHQELLEAFIVARATVSSEFSGTIRKDSLDLRRWAARYAASHSLSAPTDPEIYGIWYEDPELDAELEGEPHEGN